MDRFAKLYETDRGQILAKLDSDEDGAPEVRFYFKPRGLGVCELSVAFEDSDDGWKRAEAYFAELNLAGAERALAEVRAHADAFAEGKA